MVELLDCRGMTDGDVIKMLDRPSQLEYRDEQRDVDRILQDIRDDGDRALLNYTQKFEGVDFKTLDDIVVSETEITKAYESISPKLIAAMEKAAENIENYHRKQLQNSWFSYREDGVMLGQHITAIERVGVYVPGGRASYPSSVLMNVIPAKIAGVEQIIMVTPPLEDGSINKAILAAAKIAGVDIIYKIGGAQAIGALSYGTETIDKVEKIVGPGNIYVTLAKKQVYGLVDIDMIAGPSEILIIADNSANPIFIAADLLSQAEHDPMASAILVTTSYKLALEVKWQIEMQTKDMPTKDTINASLSKYGALIVVDSLDVAAKVSNQIAPEHLEIMTVYPERDLKLIKNAGSIFLGEYSPESLGDYMAGPNHVLPTSGTAKFYSPLGVDAFIKRSSIIQYTKKALSGDYEDIACFARAEGFEAHARAAEVRFEV